MLSLGLKPALVGPLIGGVVVTISRNPGRVFNHNLNVSVGTEMRKCYYHQQQYEFSRKNREKAERQRLAQRQKDLRALELPEDCSSETHVRDAYIKFVKKCHPDGGGPEASAEKFHEIDTAYKNLLKDFAEFRHNRHKIEGEYGLYYQPEPPSEEATEEEKENDEGPDIKHTAPQHRQYLSFDGVGSGSPAQREKQYNKYRSAKAAENVMEYRVQKVSRSSGEEVWDLAKTARASKKTKTGIGVERLVEDLIQESMSRGDFDNLSGKGKPLKHDSSYNPYIDFTTHKLNQVLIENGFAPEWIMLEKEIRQEIRRLRKELSLLRHKYNATLSPNEEEDWKNVSGLLQEDCDNLNKMILKFNLTVPSLHKQMINFQLDREAQKALSTFSPEMQQVYSKEAFRRELQVSASQSQNKSSNSSEDTFIGMLLSIFKKP